MSGDNRHLTSGRRLTRNVFLNLLGTGSPLIVAIIAIPYLIEGLGTDRFGVLTLAWMVVGYFSLFDLGLGRALTKLVAENLGRGKEGEMPILIWTALTLMTLMGIVGGVVVAMLSPWLVSTLLNIPLGMQYETLAAFYLLSASIPFVITTTGLRGVLSAYQRFGMINAILIPLGISTFLGPLLTLPFSDSLVPIVSVLIIIRLIAWSVHIIMCLRVVPRLGSSLSVRREVVWPLLNFGGWMTVTNIVGPLMVYMDRFLIGAMISMAAVAYYTTPYEVVTKLLIIPSAFMGVMFPAFSTNFAKNRGHAAQLFERAIKYIFIVMFPVVLCISTFAYSGLFLWLGSDFAESSTVVMQLLVVGVFVNSLAQVPFGLVQSAGRPDLTAKLHMVELPLYMLMLWWLLDSYGINGAAIVWALRMVVDIVVLLVMSQRLLLASNYLTVPVVLVVSFSLIILFVGILMTSLLVKMVFVISIIGLFIPFAWFYILAEDERFAVSGYLKRMPISS